MASRKSGTGRKSRKKKAGAGNRPNANLVKSVVGLTILAVVVFMAGFVTRTLLSPVSESRTADRIGHKKTFSKTVKQGADAKKPAPPFEIFPDERPQPETLRVDETHRPKTVGRPKAALIFDDIGYDRRLARKLMDLDIPLTFSILPHSPFGDEIAREARDRGIEIMLHLPMEPMEYPSVNPGPGALLTSMTPDEMIGRLEENLNAAPLAIGVNNHMGSRLTGDSNRMNQVFTILKKRNLFFIDSRTSPDSICRSSARLLRLPFAERDVFIDHTQSVEAITRQLRSLAAVAGRRGHAVGIAHPHSQTYDVLKAMLPELRQAIEFVPASTIVRESNIIAEDGGRHAIAGRIFG